MYLSNCLHLTIAQESEDVDDEDASHKVGDSLPWVGLKSRLFAGLIYLGFFLLPHHVNLWKLFALRIFLAVELQVSFSEDSKNQSV